MRHKSGSPQETTALASAFAKRLKPGDFIAFYGTLGVGKTAFIQALGQALELDKPIVSPTFSIVCEYEGALGPFYHFDLYRLSGEDDLCDIGFFDYLDAGGICAVEWSEHLGEFLPKSRYEVRLDYGSSPNERLIDIELKEG